MIENMMTNKLRSAGVIESDPAMVGAFEAGANDSQANAAIAGSKQAVTNRHETAIDFQKGVRIDGTDATSGPAEGQQSPVKGY